MRSANSSMPNVSSSSSTRRRSSACGTRCTFPWSIEVLAPCRVDVDAGALRHVADRAAHGNRLAGDVVPRDSRPPRILLGQGDEDLDRRRLALRRSVPRTRRPRPPRRGTTRRRARGRPSGTSSRAPRPRSPAPGQCRGRISSGPPAQPAHVGAGSHRPVPCQAPPLRWPHARPREAVRRAARAGGRFRA